jgi:hypothetical protein
MALTCSLVTRREIMFFTSLSKILTCMKSYPAKKLFLPCLLHAVLLTMFLISAPDEVSGHGSRPAGLDPVEKRKIYSPCREKNRCIRGKVVPVLN